MTENGTPIRARRPAPAARATALVAAAAIALAGLPASPAQAQGARQPAGHPRHRDRAALARLRHADPEGGRPRQAERQGGHPQRPGLQRLRHGRAPHLHQFRRAVRGQDAERSDRRVRARDRPFCRRPSDAPAREARARRRPLDRRPAARHRRRGGRRALRRRQYRGGGDHGAAGGDPALAARLCAHPGRPGRPCRREVPQPHPPVGQGHARSCSSG